MFYLNCFEWERRHLCGGTMTAKWGQWAARKLWGVLGYVKMKAEGVGMKCSPARGKHPVGLAGACSPAPRVGCDPVVTGQFPDVERRGRPPAPPTAAATEVSQGQARSSQPDVDPSRLERPKCSYHWVFVLGHYLEFLFCKTLSPTA